MDLIKAVIELLMQAGHLKQMINLLIIAGVIILVLIVIIFGCGILIGHFAIS